MSIFSAMISFYTGITRLALPIIVLYTFSDTIGGFIPPELTDILDDVSDDCAASQYLQQIAENVKQSPLVSLFRPIVTIRRRRLSMFCQAWLFVWPSRVNYDALNIDIGLDASIRHLADLGLDAARQIGNLTGELAQATYTAYVYYNYIWTQAVLLLICLTACVVLLCSTRVKFISIRSSPTGFDITALRSSFLEHFQDKQPPLSGDDDHESLAFQRRHLEAWCIDRLLSAYDRFRDVGGSRTRFPHLATKKHICAPELDAADIYRQYKSNDTFHNCYRKGQHCPERYRIPAAMLSHVDYHLDKDELARVVTGPTFIVNHDFDTDTSLGEREEGYDATVTKDDGLVTMTPHNGTPYGPHPYYHWKSEGCLVTPNGAFTYVRIGKFGETCVYYCHPNVGKYSLDDPKNLRRSTDRDSAFYSKFHQKFIGYQLDNGAYHIESVRHTIDAYILDEIISVFQWAKRDEKFLESLRAYTVNRLRSAGKSTESLPTIVELLLHLSDKRAVGTFSSIVIGDPASYGFLRRHVFIWLYRYEHLFPTPVLSFIRRFIKAALRSDLIPWNWRTIHLPTYDTFTGAARLTLFGKEPRTFNFQKFLAEARDVHSSADGQSPQGSRQNSGQHSNGARNKGPKRGPKTPPNAKQSTNGGKSVPHRSPVSPAEEYNGASISFEARTPPVSVPARSEPVGPERPGSGDLGNPPPSAETTQGKKNGGPGKPSPKDAKGQEKPPFYTFAPADPEDCTFHDSHYPGEDTLSIGVAVYDEPDPDFVTICVCDGDELRYTIDFERSLYDRSPLAGNDEEMALYLHAFEELCKVLRMQFSKRTDILQALLSLLSTLFGTKETQPSDEIKLPLRALDGPRRLKDGKTATVEFRNLVFQVPKGAAKAVIDCLRKVEFESGGGLESS
nr:ORF1 [Hypera postica associated sinaivirus]